MFDIQDKSLYVALFFVSLALLVYAFTSCCSLNKSFGLKNDNPIEEALEGFIEAEIGVKIDLTA